MFSLFFRIIAMTNLKIFLASWLLSLSLLQAIFVPFYASIKAMFQLRLNMTTHPPAPAQGGGLSCNGKFWRCDFSRTLVCDSHLCAVKTAPPMSLRAERSNQPCWDSLGIPCSLIATLAPLARNDKIYYCSSCERPSHSAQRLCSSRKA